MDSHLQHPLQVFQLPTFKDLFPVCVCTANGNAGVTQTAFSVILF